MHLTPWRWWQTWWDEIPADHQDAILQFCLKNRKSKVRMKDLMGESEAGFDLDLADGIAAESTFLRIFTQGKFELKRDYEVSNTGNIAVELECRGHPSGIATTESPFWCYWLSGEQYEDEVAVLIAKPRLEKLAQTGTRVRGGEGGVATLSLVDVHRLVDPKRNIRQ